MNENLLKYFQNQQAQSRGIPQQQQLDPYSQMPQEQMQQPPMQVQGYSYPQAQPENYQTPPAYSPFDVGVKRAIEASQASFAPSQNQQDRAMRSGMLAFGDAMRNSPKERGFGANAAALGAALSPALASYDNSNAYSEAQNHAMANEILEYNKYQQAEQQKQEAQAWKRDYKERELEEKKQNHLFHNFMRGAKSQGIRGEVDANGQQVDPNFAYIEGKPFKKLDAVAQRHAQDKRDALIEANDQIEETFKAFEELNNQTKDNVFAPMGGWSGIANPIKNATGRYLGVQSLKDEKALRDNFESKITRLSLALEQAGIGGKLTQGFYDRLKDIYPNARENPESFKLKLADEKRKIQRALDAAKLTVEHGADITTEQLKNLRADQNNSQNQEQQVMPEVSGNNYVHMISPNGEEYDVPQDKLQLYLQNNYQLMK